MNLSYAPIVKIIVNFAGSDYTAGTAIGADYDVVGTPIAGVLPYNARVWDNSVDLTDLKDEGEILSIAVVSNEDPVSALGGVSNASILIADSDFEFSHYTVGDADSVYGQPAGYWLGPPSKDIFYQSPWLDVSEGESGEHNPVLVDMFTSPIPYVKGTDLRMAPVLKGIKHGSSIKYDLEVIIMARVFR